MAENMLLLRFPDELSDKMRHVIHEQTKKQIRQQQQLQKQQQQLEQQHGKHGGKHLENNDKLSLESINIEVIPDDNVSINNNYTFVFGDETYPALLVNMPTIVETHKTFDKKNFFKSGDIGQALLIFLSEKDRQIARSKNIKTLTGEYYAHGLTSASYDIVNKRFLKTQQNSKIIEDTSFIKEVMEDIGVGWEAAENGKEIREFVDEEVVDFEDWMATPDEPYGISIKLKGKDIWNKTEAKVILDHPDILALPVEEEEKKEKEKVKVKQTLASSSSMSSLNIKNQAMEIEDDGNIDIEFNDHDDDGDEKEVDEDEIEKDDNDNAADDDEDDDDDENAWMDDI